MVEAADSWLGGNIPAGYDFHQTYPRSEFPSPALAPLRYIPTSPETGILKATGGSIGKEVGDAYSIPPPELFVSFSALKDRIRHHYEICSDYYYSLWGEHIHHGYFTEPSDTKEVAQRRLIQLLLEKSTLASSSTVLDVGCGIGGTSRYLAKELGCKVTGVTISGRQVEMARKLSAEEAAQQDQVTETLPNGSLKVTSDAPIQLGKIGGCVRYIELDAEKMGEYFGCEEFDCVWISEAMSHLPDKVLFFRNAAKLLKKGGKLVVADWFKRDGCTEIEMEADIKPIEDGMLLPPLCTPSDYISFAKEPGLEVFFEPFDISKQVSKTWDISWSLVQSPALWSFALAQGRDGLAFLQAFRAMRRGFANGGFRYAVMIFQK